MPDFHTLTINRTELDAGALVVHLDVPPDLTDTFSFTQGQYLTFEADIDGERVRRSYSICAGVGEPLAVAIKKIDDGRFSGYAHETFAPGVGVAVMPPDGAFFTPLEPERGRQYLLIAAGSGITPILSILKTVLAAEPESRVTLLYGNRQASSMMFRDALCWVKNAYLGRFQWINIFSRERQPAEILNGRIDNRKGGELNRRLIRIRDFDEFFLCGPEAMISEVSRGLRGEGIDEAHIHYELFFASAEDARAVVAKHHARALEYGGRLHDVRVLSGGRETRFELTADGENILDAALDNGVDLPFSCKGGVCATCRARLAEGQVDMDLNHALSDDEVASGYILTCQAHPISESVVVDFDSV